MKAGKRSLLAVVAVLALSACGPTLSPFTESLYKKNQWSEAELKRIQFYLSNDIVMRRELTGAKSEIAREETPQAEIDAPMASSLALKMLPSMT